jgi:hypothetical protein
VAQLVAENELSERSRSLGWWLKTSRANVPVARLVIESTLKTLETARSARPVSSAGLPEFGLELNEVARRPGVKETA